MTQVGSYLWKDCLDLYENFVTNVTLDKEVTVNFYKSSGSEVWIWTPDLDQILLGGGMWSLTSLVSSFNSSRYYQFVFVF